MGLPIDPMSEQHELLLDGISKSNFGLFGIQEINLNFTALEATAQWKRRFRSFQGFTTSTSNTHSNSQSKVLHGGNALFLQPTLTIRNQGSGHDPSGLGRWSWILLEGKQGMQTRVISGYRPVIDRSDRPSSVFSQHQLYFNSIDRECDPRAAFLTDLGAEISRWKDEGDQIILGADLNEDTRADLITTWTSSLGLVNIHQEKWGESTRVATCNKSTRSNNPIDGIWTTPGIHVQACGLTGFGDLDLGTRMDHRVLWADITDESLFGFPAPPPHKRKFHRFPLNDPGARQSYNRQLARGRIAANIPGTIFHLAHKAKTGNFTKGDQATYNRLADIDHQLRNKAKHRSKRFFAGKVLYSDVVSDLRKEIKLWWLVYNHRVKKRVNTRKIRSLANRFGITDALRINIPQIEKRTRDVKIRYRRAKSDQVSLRDKFRKKLARRRAVRFKTSVAAQEKTEKHTTRMIRKFSNIKLVLDRKPKTPMNNLISEAPDGTETVCNTRDEVEQACTAEAMRRFSQTNDTPFMTGPIADDIGYQACQATVDAILQGTYVTPPGTDATTSAFLRELLIPPDILRSSPINGILNPADHIAGWSRMKGRIASSPHGPVFADYIAGSDHLRTAEIDVAFANIPLLAGFSPTSWCKALDVMIPKKGRSRHVKKLRIIVLFHALFNMLNKRIGREMVHRADSLNLIPDEAYGSRPGRRANICALNKVLTADLFRQKRQAGIICSNDATSCYDRIVHSVATICMQRMGVTPEVCQLMFGTLRQLEHFITTDFGQKEEPYGAVEIPLQGVGQGNGAGPAIWLVMTIPLINMLRSAGLGLRSTSSISGEDIFFSCFTFVDDTDTVLSSPTRISTSALIGDMQHALDLWGGGLRATGGSLAISKTYWWLVDFDWHNPSQSWRYSTMDTRPGSLVLKSDTQPPDRITRLAASTSQETLGIHIAMDGNQASMVASLTSRVEIWADKIRSRQLSKQEAWLSLTTGISKGLQYPLVATTLSYKECTRITKSLKVIALPAIGVPRNFPHALVFAPKRFLGYSLPDLWFDQNFAQMDAVLHHGHRTNDITGKLLRQQSEHLRLELGLPSTPFAYPFHQWHKCTTFTYLWRLWEYCTSANLELRDHLPPIPLPRLNDQFLMMAFANHGYTPGELAILNTCRIHCRVLFVSDLSTGDGHHLLPSAFSSREPRSSQSHLGWPRTTSPNNHSWRLWTDALQSCFLPPLADTRLTLSSPLGEWLSVSPSWPAWFHPPTNHVYVTVSDGRLEKCAPLSQRHGTRQLRYHRQSFTSELPLGCLPTTTIGNYTSFIITGSSRLRPSYSTDTDTGWWGIPVLEAQSIDQLIQGIRDGTAVGLTDGSFRDGCGTAAFTLRSDIRVKDNDLIMVNHTPGLPTDVDPYRAELGGALGVIRTANRIVSHLPPASLANAAITLSLDCLSVLQKLFDDSDPHPHTPHYDLIMVTRQALADSPLHWHHRHVYGHRDAILPYEALDSWEQLNCDMDLLAKSFWNTVSSSARPIHHLPPFRGQWSLWHGDTRLVNWTRARAEDLYYGSSAKAYWGKKLDLPPAMCDWQALGKAFQRLTLSRQLWLPRYLTTFLPIGKNLLLWRISSDNLCPRCPQPELTRHHILRCPHVEARAIVASSLTALDKWMLSVETQPSLRKHCIAMLHAWHTDSPWRVPLNTSLPVRNALRQQFALGLHALADGFIHPSWSETQQKYYEYLGRRRTGLRWHTQLIRRLWETAWDLWSHRLRILDSPDSLALARQHDSLNERIDQAFLACPSPLPATARRWFSRTPEHLYPESIDFKTLWLEMVHSIPGLLPT
jgi:hypothetical protein